MKTHEQQSKRPSNPGKSPLPDAAVKPKTFLEKKADEYVGTIDAIWMETVSATATIQQIIDRPDPDHGMAMVGVVQGLVDRASTRAAELDVLINRIGEANAGAAVTPALKMLKSVCGPPFVQTVIRAKAVLRGEVHSDDLFADWYGKSIALFESVQRMFQVIDRAAAFHAAK